MLRTTFKQFTPIIKSIQPLASTSRLASSSSSSSPSSSTSASVSTTTPSTSSSSESEKTHYLITLRRSPLHLPSPIKSSCKSLGLGHRLASSIVPITQENAGYILRIKELITVKLLGIDEISRAVDQSWSLREGEGRRGSGLHLMREGAEVIRVGTERSRGEERGFKVIQ